MRVVLFGDGKWAANHLRLLLDAGHEVAAAVLRCNPSDDSLSRAADESGVPTRTFADVNSAEVVEWIRSLHVELNVSVSFDQIIRRALRESAPAGFINGHAGMLPRYRGRNVINWAIINNEREVGLTAHYIDDGVDTGDIIHQESVPIDWTDGYGDVLAKVHSRLPQVVLRAVQDIAQGRVVRRPQNHELATYFCRRREGDELIDWRDTSLAIYNKIRAITEPGPGAVATLRGEELRLWSAEYQPTWPRYRAIPGEVVGIERGRGIWVKTGDSTILLTCFEDTSGTGKRVPRLPIGTRFDVPGR